MNTLLLALLLQTAPNLVPPIVHPVSPNTTACAITTDDAGNPIATRECAEILGKSNQRVDTTKAVQIRDGVRYYKVEAASPFKLTGTSDAVVHTVTDASTPEGPIEQGFALPTDGRLRVCCDTVVITQYVYKPLSNVTTYELARMIPYLLQQGGTISVGGSDGSRTQYYQFTADDIKALGTAARHFTQVR